ncbi:MAG: flagellar protein [Lachnospiraceae bacterium]|nr:flagellar protein [Lachnospiraceae bacterium]
MNRLDGNFTSIEQIQNQYLGKISKPANQAKDATSFKDVLSGKMEDVIGNTSEVKFSKHAANRLMERSISLSPEQSERLSNGIQMAYEKGINDSLVMVDKMAFIVNVPSHTVVTAMDENSTTEHNVFTNIDGAVIA